MTAEKRCYMIRTGPTGEENDEETLLRFLRQTGMSYVVRDAADSLPSKDQLHALLAFESELRHSDRYSPVIIDAESEEGKAILEALQALAAVETVTFDIGKGPVTVGCCPACGSLGPCGCVGAPETAERPTKPLLGLASTAELLAELQARAEVGGYAGYRTVGCVGCYSTPCVCVEVSNAQKTSGDPNPLDPTNHFFRKCLKGHVAYSISFDECPSCKIERERAESPRDSAPIVSSTCQHDWLPPTLGGDPCSCRKCGMLLKDS